MRQPEFANLLRVLDRKAAARPTLFEFFLNEDLYKRLAKVAAMKPGLLDRFRICMAAYARAGYDYVTVMGSGFGFPAKQVDHAASRSMSETGIIGDRAGFAAYAWRNPADFDYSHLDVLQRELPAGMKMIVWGPGGVLENVMQLVGYEPLCLMLMDDPGLVGDIFDAVGSRLVKYYEICSPHPGVGALISNDDWGFHTQTMLSPADMRKYVFPWHRKIVATIHAAGKPAILHSCGNLDAVMDDIIDDMKYDGKHSYEDKIIPVEEAYEKWGRRIAILGGIDVDFICRSKPAEITRRCQAMLERAQGRGSYALGTGNSVPYYVPQEGYFAMISAATGLKCE